MMVSSGSVWVSVATKNLTVGYLLAREARTTVGLVLFTFALALEFTVGDRGMHADHQANLIVSVGGCWPERCSSAG